MEEQPDSQFSVVELGLRGFFQASILRVVKLFRPFIWLLIVPAVLLLATGCGGIQASRSISPLDFLLPGLLQNKPATNDAAKVASQPHNDPARSAAQPL